MAEEDIKSTEDSEDLPLDDSIMIKFGYINQVATEVFGDLIGFSLTPVLDENENVVVVMICGSLKYNDIKMKAIFNLEDMSETRIACIVFANNILTQEQEYDRTAGGKLIVPSNNLIIPGR